VVRLFRMLVSMKDDFYDKHIEKNNLLGPIIDVFLENGPRYNLLNSAVLELCDTIRQVRLSLRVWVSPSLSAMC
jgi:protein phosphatase-4 regulatory subunit 3